MHIPSNIVGFAVGLALGLFSLAAAAQELAAQDAGAEAAPSAAAEAAPAADAGPGAAEAPGLAPIPITDQTIEQYLWESRLLVIFADTPLDPSYIRQMELLATRPEILAERDVVVLTDTDPRARSAIRTALRPRGFALVIVDKDGQVMLRKPSPWDLREITRAIDKTPLRLQEMRDARDALEAEARERNQPQE